MRPTAKIKSTALSYPLRQAALTATAAGRRTYPAWIDATERIATFHATVVTPRVRDGLILRQVMKAKPRISKISTDATRAR